MRSEPPLSEQIAYAEDELERSLQLAPKLIKTGVRTAEAASREIELQTAILATLKRQQRVLEAIPADLTSACDGISSAIMMIRTVVEGGYQREQHVA